MDNLRFAIIDMLKIKEPSSVCEEIVQLWYECEKHRSSLYKFNFDPLMPYEKFKDRVLEIHPTTKEWKFFVAYDGFKLVGMASFATYKDFENNVSINTVFVRDDYRRRGIATKLLTDGIAHFRGKGFSLTVFHNNPAALKLYERLEFDINASFSEMIKK